MQGAVGVRPYETPFSRDRIWSILNAPDTMPGWCAFARVRTKESLHEPAVVR